MYYIDKNKDLTMNQITDIISSFETNERVKLERYYNYYLGKQEILNKKYADDNKPCNKIVTNYCYNIVQNYLGYICGVDISYTSENDIERIQQILNYNDSKTTDSELLRNALIYGVAYEIEYLDEEAQERFKVLDSREVIPIYDNTINQDLAYVIRYWHIDTIDKQKGYYIEVYSDKDVIRFESNSAFAGMRMIESVPHYYGQVPIIVFQLNLEQESIFDKVMTLQDAYNSLLSSEIDDFQAFVDAYLILKGLDADADDIAEMKHNRVLLLDADADATYLTKNVSDTQIQNMLQNINDTIHKIANSPDFNDEKLLAQSGIAMRYKLTGFENNSAAIVANMTKALQKRIELICAILKLTGTETVWRDIEITFTRNLPVNLLEIAQVVNQLRGVVSDKTLLTLLPFVSDVNKETELLQAQNENALYDFSAGGTDE